MGKDHPSQHIQIIRGLHHIASSGLHQLACHELEILLCDLVEHTLDASLEGRRRPRAPGALRSPVLQPSLGRQRQHHHLRRQLGPQHRHLPLRGAQPRLPERHPPPRLPQGPDQLLTTKDPLIGQVVVGVHWVHQHGLLAADVALNLSWGVDRKASQPLTPGDFGIGQIQEHSPGRGHELRDGSVLGCSGRVDSGSLHEPRGRVVEHRAEGLVFHPPLHQTGCALDGGRLAQQELLPLQTKAALEKLPDVGGRGLDCFQQLCRLIVKIRSE
mmetsp:Transcript_50043/g.109424  ORF Transcript_50043/g.109424 Transcript_50043/m.109424 type:complete len:271 (-) Transcript_50043:948-1760(-)